MKHLITVFALLFLPFTLVGQKLKPGFDKAEYIELLKVSARFGDSTYINAFPAPQQFKFVYRSPTVGLENVWDLWADNQGIAVISLRGTTRSSVSWLGNFYAAMVPAKGEIQISDTEKFTYELATSPRAAVHVGWLVTMAFLAKDILPKIDSCYKAGIRDMIIMGHSQGGAIAFLLTSHLKNLQNSLEFLPIFVLRRTAARGQNQEIYRMRMNMKLLRKEAGGTMSSTQPIGCQKYLLLYRRSMILTRPIHLRALPP